jgi:adenylate kinase
MGPVGSGKSEQTARLVAKHRLEAISTSQILRKHLTPQRKSRMLAGDLIEDQEIIELMQPALVRQQTTGQEFILDGFPRSKMQAQWLVEQIREGMINLRAVIKLSVSNDTVLKRLLARGRVDDTEEIIKHRLETYYRVTDPVLGYLREQKMPVYELDGEQTPEAISEKINKIFDETKNQ